MWENKFRSEKENYLQRKSELFCKKTYLQVSYLKTIKISVCRVFLDTKKWVQILVKEKKLIAGVV